MVLLEGRGTVWTPSTATTPSIEAVPVEPKSSGELRDLTAPAVEKDSNQAVGDAEPYVEKARPARRNRRGGMGGREISGLGDANLPAGETARVLVAVFGNAQANGPVDEAVVAVFGNSTRWREGTRRWRFRQR